MDDNVLNLIFNGGDDIFDVQVMDINSDGNIDMIIRTGDVDGNGTQDVVVFTDTTHDGILDTVTVHLDTTGDEQVDSLLNYAYDEAGNLHLIDTYSDTDGNGIFDVHIFHDDFTGDGIKDTIMIEDENHDGNPDTITIYDDENYDFIIHEQHIDTTEGGIEDIIIVKYDLDGDSIFDKVEIYRDENGSGEFEFIYAETLDDKSAEFANQGVFDWTNGNVNGEVNSDLDWFPNYDPHVPEIAQSKISGTPEQDMVFWEYQGDTGRCNLYAEKFVIESLTGVEIDIDDFVKVAELNGWFVETGAFSGTSNQYMNKMLDLYGIDNKTGYDGTIDNIEECLRDGGKVIVSVNSGEIWYGEDSGIYSPGNAADHALEVIGIDHSNPGNPMVILNDSGHPDGCGAMIPLDQFVDAWEDGGCHYTFAYA